MNGPPFFYPTLLPFTLDLYSNVLCCCCVIFIHAIFFLLSIATDCHVTATGWATSDSNLGNHLVHFNSLPTIWILSIWKCAAKREKKGQNQFCSLVLLMYLAARHWSFHKLLTIAWLISRWRCQVDSIFKRVPILKREHEQIHYMERKKKRRLINWNCSNENCRDCVQPREKENYRSFFTTIVWKSRLESNLFDSERKMIWTVRELHAIYGFFIFNFALHIFHFRYIFIFIFILYLYNVQS